MYVLRYGASKMTLRAHLGRIARQRRWLHSLSSTIRSSNGSLLLSRRSNEMGGGFNFRQFASVVLDDQDESDQPMISVEFHDDNDGWITVIEVPEGTKITEAADKAGIYIPTLCHHPRLPSAGKCGVCVCATEGGPTPTQLACTTVCRNNDDGSPMKVHVHGTVLNGLASSALRRNLEVSMENKTKRFGGNRGGNLEINHVANWLGKENRDCSSKSITYDPSLCIGCDRCTRACDQLQGMNVLESQMPSSQPSVGIAQAPPCMSTKAGRPLSETDCISCGQCTSFCPTGAIKEVDHTARVMQALADPSKVVVLQTAPSVRVTLAEAFGGSPGDCTPGKLVGAAKKCGFEFVFDANMSADLTIMEEATELLKRIEIAQSGTEEEKKKSPLPMFTSCCPGWVNLVEQSYPELIPHLSSCKSPMSMLSSIIRRHWWPKEVANQAKVDQSNLFVVSVMPCTAKKDEMARHQLAMENGNPDTDAVLTVREMARLMELRGVAQMDNFDSFAKIPELAYDNPFGESTGAAVIFGATGGVMEAALRTAADVLSGEDLPNLDYQQVRGLQGVKESTLQLGKDKEISLNVAVCQQMKHVREFLAGLKEGNKNYHFIEIMTCPGGCIGGGGLPQSRDADILEKRMSATYSIDERSVKRKSHENEAVKGLYKDLLGEPLSHKSHELLHTHYSKRPRQPPAMLKASGSQANAVPADLGDDANNIYIVFGTQSGTSSQAAKEIKMELQQYIGRAKMNPEPQVCLVAGNSMPEADLLERIKGSMASIFVTCTYGEGEIPDMMQKLWDQLETSEGVPEENPFKYAVFGLCSSMYDIGDQFNRAARSFDGMLEELGGERLVDVGVGDDQNSEGYRGALDPWMEQLQPKLFASAGGAVKTSLLDPPEPLFKISLAPSSHGPSFRPLPPNYHFVTLENDPQSLVSEGYDRPAALFSFDLENTGLDYKCGDHLAVLPRNPDDVVERILSMYGIDGQQLLSVEAMDPHGDCPYPKVLSIQELLAQYLDFCGRPSRSFFKQLFMFATTDESRNRLRDLFERDRLPQEEFDTYTDQNTYADVLFEFEKDSLPPFEYLLSMIPTNTPRFYSIASSPLVDENKLELLVVKNDWKDSAKKQRNGLNTQYLFNAKKGDKVAVQVHTGILQPPELDEELDTPVVMFCLGAGLAPFRGFLQHRQALIELKNQEEEETGVHTDLGPATLYFGSRHRAHDYYLEDYFKDCIEQGALTAIHTAFSRDGLGPDGKKRYVYSVIGEEPMEMAKALGMEDGTPNDKARVYYCGPARGIPEAIQESMTKALIAENGIHMDEDEAKEYIERMVNKDKRFNAECF